MLFYLLLPVQATTRAHLTDVYLTQTPVPVATYSLPCPSRLPSLRIRSSTSLCPISRCSTSLLSNGSVWPAGALRSVSRYSQISLSSCLWPSRKQYGPHRAGRVGFPWPLVLLRHRRAQNDKAHLCASRKLPMTYAMKIQSKMETTCSFVSSTLTTCLRTPYVRTGDGTRLPLGRGGCSPWLWVKTDNEG
jgi:hypothetical protein